MQSKTLSSKGRLFNATLFRKNLARFWPLWGMASFLGSLVPLTLLLQIIRQNVRIEPLEMTSVYYTALTVAVPVISLLYAVLCAMMVWSYLYTARSAGLMHTLPIRREGLLVTNFLSGMAMMLIPYAVTGGLCVLISLFFGGFEPVGLLMTVLGVAGLSFFYFASATLVAFVTGNIFALPALYFLLHFLAVLLDGLLSTLASGFIFGLRSGYSGEAYFLSPTVHLLSKLGVSVTDREIAVPGRPWPNYVLESVTLENFWLVGIYVLAGLALLALAYLLYRRRHMERAGDVVAVEWMRPVFRYGLAALTGLSGGMGLYALFWMQFQEGENFDALPMVLCMAVAAVIGYYAASMLLAKSLRVFRGNWIGAAVVAGLAALVCFGLQADILGVANRVPEISQVKTVELYVANNTYTFYAGEEDELLEQVRQVHAAIAADRDYIQRTEREARYEETAGISLHNYVRLSYRLSSGVTVERRYSVPITQERLNQPGTYDRLLDDLVNGEAMKAKRLYAGDSRYVVESAWISSSWSERYYDLNSREAQGLLDAVSRDAAAGNWGRHNWFDDNREAYAVDVLVRFRRGGDDADGRGYNSIKITLRPGMTETLGYLLDLGALTEGDLLTNEERYPYDYDENWDGAEIQAEENAALRAALADERIPAGVPADYEIPTAAVLENPAV